MMSKEAMKLALEALKQIDEAMPFPVAKLAQAALREALAEQPAQQEPCKACNGTGETETGIGMMVCDECHGTTYTSPPAQRKPWVGLTVCERTECFNSAEWNDLTQYAEVIEAKLKEKNT